MWNSKPNNPSPAWGGNNVSQGNTGFGGGTNNFGNGTNSFGATGTFNQ